MYLFSSLLTWGSNTYPTGSLWDVTEAVCVEHSAQDLASSNSSGNISCDFHTTDSAQFSWGLCPSSGEEMLVQSCKQLNPGSLILSTTYLLSWRFTRGPRLQWWSVDHEHESLQGLSPVGLEQTFRPLEGKGMSPLSLKFLPLLWAVLISKVTFTAKHSLQALWSLFLLCAAMDVFSCPLLGKHSCTKLVSSPVFSK